MTEVWLIFGSKTNPKGDQMSNYTVKLIWIFEADQLRWFMKRLRSKKRADLSILFHIWKKYHYNTDEQKYLLLNVMLTVKTFLSLRGTGYVSPCFLSGVLLQGEER